MRFLDKAESSISIIAAVIGIIALGIAVNQSDFIKSDWFKFTTAGVAGLTVLIKLVMWLFEKRELQKKERNK